MKTLMLIIVIALVQMTGIAQTKSSDKTESVEFKVYGNCGMCKSRIEKALKVEGIKSAKWDTKTKLVTISYQSDKINEDKLHQLIADAGHDTEKILAKNEAYNKLHACCQYERNEEFTGKEMKNKKQNNHENHKH